MSLGSLTQYAIRFVKVARHIDRRVAVRRLSYELARRSGWYKRRYPAGRIEMWLPANGDAVVEAVRRGRRFMWGEAREDWQAFYRRRFSSTAEATLEHAERIIRGEQQYFFHHWHNWGGLPDWLANPITGKRVPETAHWSELSWDSPDYGDMKFVLEPSRAAWSFAMVRAYWHTGDERYAQTFWRLVEDWAAKNPPQAGPLWVCGQESALRIMAWTFGLFGLAGSPHSTAERIAKMVALLVAHADRIEGTRAYAKSQRNNHDVNEAAALWTIGLLFPELPQAQRWRDVGRQDLEESILDQVYDDGAYIQHSINYHRVMMQSLAWSIALGRAAGEPLSDEMTRRLALAARFLEQLIDPISCRSPNLGSNDGALVLPLSACDFADYQPAVQAAARLTTGQDAIGSGPWDEEAFWLCGPNDPAHPQSASIAAKAPSSSAFPIGGYYTIHATHSWALCRAAAYRDRPGQCDQLHLDLWWRGQNIARDAGSYLYNGPPPWGNALAETAVHNTATVNGHDQMTRGGRFLWLDWARAAVERQVASPSGHFELWQAWHDGYRRLRHPAWHRRSVLRIGGENWLVLDWLTSPATHDYRLHWLLCDVPHDFQPAVGRLGLRLPIGDYDVVWGTFAGAAEASLARADESTTRGWQSPHYGFKKPALSLAATSRGERVGFWTVFGPPPMAVRRDSDGLAIELPSESTRVAITEDELGGRIARVSRSTLDSDSIDEWVLSR